MKNNNTKELPKWISKEHLNLGLEENEDGIIVPVVITDTSLDLSDLDTYDKVLLDSLVDNQLLGFVHRVEDLSKSEDLDSLVTKDNFESKLKSLDCTLVEMTGLIIMDSDSHEYTYYKGNLTSRYRNEGKLYIDNDLLCRSIMLFLAPRLLGLSGA